jgi:hypothetical protein
LCTIYHKLSCYETTNFCVEKYPDYNMVSHCVVFRDKNGDIQLNEINNPEILEDRNNIEHSGQDDESPTLEDPPARASPSPSPPPPTRIGVEESQRDHGKKVVVHAPPSGLTSSVNSSEEEYPINASAVSHGSPSHLPRNDSQLVTGSDTPSGNGTFLGRAQNGASHTNSSPSSHRAVASPNDTDPIISDNRVAEVTTTHQDASNDQECPGDLVTPEIKPTVLPNRPLLLTHSATSPEVRCAEEYDEPVRTSNPPNGLVFSIPKL